MMNNMDILITALQFCGILCVFLACIAEIESEEF